MQLLNRKWFLVQCNFSWLYFFFLRYDAAIFDLICLLFCIFGSVHLVVLVPDIRPIAVQLSLCSLGYFHRGTLDWTLFIPVPVLSRSSSTQWLLCKVRDKNSLRHQRGGGPLIWLCLNFRVLFLMDGVLLGMGKAVNLLNGTV